MKRRLGGEKFTARERLCWHWYPTPGCNMHREIVGERRGNILFEKYCNINRRRGSNPNLMYWRSHPREWAEIQRRVGKTQ
jgi:hypothetical protein